MIVGIVGRGEGFFEEMWCEFSIVVLGGGYFVCSCILERWVGNFFVCCVSVLLSLGVIVFDVVFGFGYFLVCFFNLEIVGFLVCF